MNEQVPLIDIHEVHRAVGAIAAAASNLELCLADAVTSLTRSPLTSIVVQGERGNTLVEMCRRLLDRGIGSTREDEAIGRTSRLGLVSATDTEDFHEVLKACAALFRRRDEVVHSIWLANFEPGELRGSRTTRARKVTKAWTLIELEQLRQELANAQYDVFACAWNTSGSGMPLMDCRTGDVG